MNAVAVWSMGLGMGIERLGFSESVEIRAYSESSDGRGYGRKVVGSPVKAMSCKMSSSTDEYVRLVQFKITRS